MNRKRRQQSEFESDETWLIPYADLLTLLLALFIVLFATSQIDAQKFRDLSGALSAAFNGNVSFFEYTSIVPEDAYTYQEEKGDNLDSDQILGIHDTREEPRDYADQYDEKMLTSLQEHVRMETQQLQQLKEDLDRYIEEHQLSTQLQTELNHEQLKITIRDNALFDLGSAEVKPEARRLAVAISELLEEYEEFEVVVSGHTDNLPISTARFRSNWDLSAFRAINFMNVLLENENLDPARFTNSAYGEFRPIASNDTAEGRAQNRRVELSILRNITLPPEEIISVN